MYKFLQVFLIFYISTIVFVLIDMGEANNSETVGQYRSRRYLAFMNISRFYLKFNFKANLVPWNQLFAQAIGFKMTWDEPPSNFRRYHRIYRRNIYDYVETLIDKNGMSGFHCVRRAICELEAITESRNTYHKLLKIVFRNLSTATERWHNTTEEKCQKSIWTCPFSLLDATPYTDIA